MRPAHVSQKISAYTYVHGDFDYNEMPLAPLGCAVEVYEHPTRRKSWAEHTASGFYVGTSSEHYRCHRIWVNKTKSERISDTVFFKHKHITQPTVTPEDIIIKALQDLKHAVKGTKNHKGDANMEALQKLDALFAKEPQQEKTTTNKRVQFTTKEPEVISYDEDPRVPINQNIGQNKQTSSLLTVPQRTGSGCNRRAAEPTTRVTAAAPRVAEAAPTQTRAAPRVAPRRLIVESNNTPANNTRSRSGGPANNTRSKSQGQLLSAIEMFTKRKVVQGKDPMTELLESANSVLDVETGKMLEYRHLRQHPKYKDE